MKWNVEPLISNVNKEKQFNKMASGDECKAWHIKDSRAKGHIIVKHHGPTAKTMVMFIEVRSSRVT